MKKLLSGLALAGLMLSTAIMPAIASAQSLKDLERIVTQRQQKKNEWRNIGIGSALVSLFGLVKGDNTLMFAGAAGALYSAYRYEQDRKSQSRSARARAELFRRQSFTRNGVRYQRRTVKKNGKTYYQFARVGKKH